MTQPNTDIPDISSANMADKADTQAIDWIEILSVLWLSRKLIAYVTGGVTLLSIVISLILPEYYKSTATLLPETEKSKLASLGGLSDLAALTGVNIGGEGSFAKLYPMIIKSEAVLKNVIYAQYQTKKFKESVDLIQFWEIEEKKPGSSFEVALKSLREALDVSTDLKTGLITLTIEMKEPQLSADILNNSVEELDKFILTKRTTSASGQRKFIEGRLNDLKGDLTRSENALKEFRGRNLQVHSAQLMLEQGRLEREVQLNTVLFVELKKQYEIAKIEEVKNLPVINILDKARSAAQKESPRRTLIVVSYFLFSLVMGVGYVLGERYRGSEIREWVRKVRESKR